MNESEKISAVIPADLLERLVVRAREADRSVSAEVRQAIRAYVAQPANGEREPKEKER
ncbi:MAG: ribbon-helix-helix protein, CopG family [Actinobacteria bacterium]|nr:ribbon-helix-helix protein, CopG family [Actinomycetota bacterium]